MRVKTIDLIDLLVVVIFFTDCPETRISKQFVILRLKAVPTEMEALGELQVRNANSARQAGQPV